MRQRFLPIALLFLLVFSLPQTAAAIVCPGEVDLPPDNFEEIACLVLEYADPLLILLASASLLVFIWGIAKFIWASGDEKKLEEGKRLMFWGIIALFVMVSVWSIIQFFFSDVFGGYGVGLPFLPI